MMLLHLRPRCFSPFQAVELVDLAIPELDFKLAGGKDLATRRPYPNKRYAVACRKIGRKAIDGIFIETNTALRSFSMVSRWVVDAEFVGVHRVSYMIVDNDFDAASDDVALWRAMSPSLGGWPSRVPQLPAGESRLVPVRANPCMEFVPTDREFLFPSMDVFDPGSGWIRERHQLLQMPTLERDRIFSRAGAYHDRRPPAESAFTAIVSAK